MTEKLGTLEFSSALNGDDTEQVINVLKRFVKTVRKERTQAFFSEDGQSKGSELDSDSSSESDEESEDESDIHGKPSKKSRTEKWKFDTMSYNVPFVGTSTHKGSTGAVQSGCWPTGFLEAYLVQSPLAMEILGSDFQRLLSKGNDKMQCAFIQAMGEVISSMIPTGKIEDLENIFDLDRVKIPPNTMSLAYPSHNQIISMVMKEYQKNIFSVMNEHAFSQSSQSLLISALTTVKYLAMTSVGTAREIARGIEFHLKDGVLHKLAAYSIAAKMKKNIDGEDVDSTIENSKQQRIGLKVRTAFLDLTSSLLEYNDAAILSYITSAGGKDSKLKAGALYHGLRTGLSQTKKFLDTTSNDSATNSIEEMYQLSFFNVLRLMKIALFKSDGERENTENSQIKTRQSLSNKAQLDLIKGPTLEAFIEIGYSPLRETKEEEDDSYLPDLKSECKEMVRMLLRDADKSPLLKQINSIGSMETTGLAVLQQTGKAMQILLTISPTLDTRKFALACFQKTPRLFQYWLRTVSLPDIKPSYSCLAKFSLVSYMLKNGPDLSTIDAQKFHDTDKKRTFDLIVSYTTPRALTKNVLTKGIQSSNPLLVSEALILLSSLLRRFSAIVKNIPSGEKREYAAERLLLKMPDLQVLLGVRSKFDPHGHETSSQHARHHNFVTMGICEALCLYAHNFPTSFRIVQFEWIKLLSDSTTAFLLAPLSLQHRILTTLLTINDCYERVAPQSNSMSSTKAYHAFTSILLETKNVTVYQLARRLVHKTITNVVNTPGTEGGSGHLKDYEISLWIDGTTSSTTAMFGKLLSAAQKVTIQHTTIVSNAWEAHYPQECMPVIPVTPLLVLSLSALVSNEEKVPNDFIILIRDISTKMLLIQSDQRVLASIFVYLRKIHPTSGPAEECFLDTFKFASAVMGKSPDKIGEIELQAVESAFGKNHYHTSVAKFTKTGKTSGLAWKNICDTYAHEARCEIICQCIRHLSESDYLGKMLSHFLAHSLFIGGSWETYLTGLVLNLNQSSPSSALVCSLFTYCATNHDLERQSFVCNKIIEDLRKAVDKGFKGGKGGTGLNQLLLLVSGLLKDFTSDAMGSLTGTLCGICLDLEEDESRRPYYAVLLKTIKTSSFRMDYIASLSSTDVAAIFMLWNALSEAHHDESPTDSVEIPLLLKLEDLMATMIADSEIHCLSAAIIVKCIQEKGTDTVVELAHNNLAHDDLNTKYGGPDRSRCRFLESLMIYDASLFSTKIVGRAATMINTTDESRLKDEIGAICIREVLNQNHCPTQDWQDTVSSDLIDRICFILQQLIDDEVLHESSDLILDVVSKMWTCNQLTAHLKEKIVSQVADLMLHWKKLKYREVPKVLEKSVLNLICVAATCSSDPTENRAILLLRNVTLTYVVKMFPKAVKLKGEHRHSSELMLSATKRLVEIGNIHGVDCLQGILIVCLKFGIGLDDAQISPQCLEISRIVISNAYTNEKESHCFTPHQVHSMILTHSNFPKVAGQRSETRKHLLSLLITCVSLNNDKFDFNGEHLAPLLMAFNASVSQEDLLLRRLLSLYETMDDSDQDHLFFMHDLVWGESINTSQSESFITGIDFGHQWEHFIDRLDIDRVRKTMNDFPVWDAIKPTDDIEPWACNDEVNSIKEYSDDDDSQGKSIISSESSDDECVSTKTKIIHHKVNSSQYEMYSRDEDERYSPGFIMPMILGTLESFGELVDNAKEEEPPVVSNEECYDRKRPFTDHQSKDEFKSNPLKESFAKVAYRLCEKGAIALSAACLSSNCPDLRSIAIAVIYRFLQAMNSTEAQNILEWKSRSQLQMALSSVQRGLMVIRANRIVKRNDDEERSLLVPMLPNVSSLFLARSLFTLTKPADDLYSAINKSFLRLGDHHGAFTDCFSLPAFMSLFCSAHDSPDQARKERMWALILLKDGTVDSYSYRMASRRHVPELLLTAFDALFTRKDSIKDDQECILLLETIESLVKRGESSSFFHYFHAVGLTSWMQCSLNAIALNLDAKSPRVVRGFIQLTNTIIGKLANESSKVNNKFHDLTNLNAVNVARDVTDIVAASTSAKPGRRPIAIKTEMVQHAHGILRSLYTILGHQPATGVTLQFHPHGLQLNSCLQIIESAKTVETCELKRLIVALCSFPIEVDCSNEGASKLALEALQVILTDGSSKDTVALSSHQCSSILHRLSTLSPFITEGHRCCSIIDNLIGCRRILVTNHGLFAEWLSCVKIFVKGYERSSQNSANNSSYTELLNAFRS